MNRWMLLMVALLASVALLAQDGQGPQGPADPQGPPPAAPRGGQWMGGPQGGPGPFGPGMRRAPDGMHGKWWKNSEVVKDLGLTDAQVGQIEKSFQDHRMQLVDLHANLEKAELGLEPMMQADQPNEAQVTAQIDKIAQARAALEKSNAQMLLGVRRILTVDQWKKLQARHGRSPEPRPGAFRPNRPRRMPGPAGRPAPAPVAPTDE